ncbi:GUN4 domain-containing protein [Nodosilinea sp. P-1105]|uniref:GUN4 domain-containing protein n=1 Tax=Nodosilinea sp. P-1105 TaxID=2546229 RepID=UPI00146D97DC|nr:GUN4 domain-containing protein [Nodosilinea sp. P-1105]NMF86000.1 TIR domain-containing protein [Nodosilinea sp. P-1105]
MIASPIQTLTEKQVSQKSRKRFDIALTFPGEHRKYVQDVAEFLAVRCSYERVFYDSWYQEELARSRLDNHLHKIYTKESELVVVFLSQEYGEKFWCKLEWNAIQTIQFRSQPVEQVLLVGLSRLEENAVSGIDRTHGYLNAEGKNPQELGKLILQRLERLGIKPRYAQLETLLKAGKWKEADWETAQQMRHVMGRQDEGRLRKEDIEKFPCGDLRAINQLWVTHSKGKFGFSVQKKIWQQCGSPVFSSIIPKEWGKFGEAVGWRSKGLMGIGAQWKTNWGWDYFAAPFPLGHFPRLGLISFIGYETERARESDSLAASGVMVPLRRLTEEEQERAWIERAQVRFLEDWFFRLISREDVNSDSI